MRILMRGLMTRSVMLLALICMFTILFHVHGEEPAKPSWPMLLKSGDEAERQKAQNVVVRDRSRTIERLIAIVRSPMERGEPYYTSTTPRNIAIRLLGKLRAKEAVPWLVSWLEPRPGQGMYTGELMMFSHAGYALADIGLPSVRPLLKIIIEKGCSSAETQKAIIQGTGVRFKPEKLKRSSPLGDQCLKIIVRILGGEHTRLLLENAIKNETSKEKKRNLESARELLASPKVPEILKKRGLFGRP